jgi:hypothetical protein
MRDFLEREKQREETCSFCWRETEGVGVLFFWGERDGGRSLYYAGDKDGNSGWDAL